MKMDEVPTSPQFSRFERFQIFTVGADVETLSRCATSDIENVQTVFWLMGCTWLYQAGLFAIVAHRLFAAPGQIRPGLILVAAFLATFIALLDSYTVMRSGWYLSGLNELKRGGIDISGGIAARIKTGVFLLLRIFLSVGNALLTAIFLTLLIFHNDVDAPIQQRYLNANFSLIHDATVMIDGDIKRAADAADRQAKRVDGLAAQVSALRQNAIDPYANDSRVQQAQQELTQLNAESARAEEQLREAETFATNELAGVKGAPGNSGHAGRGLRYRAAVEQAVNASERAKSAASALNAARARLDALRQQDLPANGAAGQQAHDRLAAFESTLTAEETKMAGMKDKLAALTESRDEAIHRAVDNAPGHVAVDNGLLTQIRELEKLGESDSKIKGFIILIDAVSFVFELAAVLAKTFSQTPTGYAALIARDSYMNAVRIAREMEDELDELEEGAEENTKSGEPSMDKPANDNRFGLGAILKASPFGGPEDRPPQPPRRPRGRPRKVIA